MLRIDDPLLSMILRFVSSHNDLGQAEETFMQRELAELQAYVSRFPKEDKEQMALAWVEKHAQAYRRNWEKKAAAAYACKTQCEDCPMVIKEPKAHCVIHQQWLQLLDDYCGDSISTQTYIEKALALLQEHKDHLAFDPNKPHSPFTVK